MDCSESREAYVTVRNAFVPCYADPNRSVRLKTCLRFDAGNSRQSAERKEAII